MTVRKAIRTDNLVVERWQEGYDDCYVQVVYARPSEDDEVSGRGSGGNHDIALARALRDLANELHREDGSWGRP